MDSKPSNKDDVREKETYKKIYTPWDFYILFGIAGVILFVIGAFRFSTSNDNAYFIYICLISFAIVAFPWVSSIQLTGIFKIDNAINKVRKETHDQVDQASKLFDNKLLSLRTELVSQLTNIQYQALQQKTEQVVHVDLGASALAAVKSTEDMKLESNEGKSQLSIPPPNELPKKYSELRIGFAKATSVALNDPYGYRCGSLIRQIPDNGQLAKEFEAAKAEKNVTDEQVLSMKTLGLVTDKGSNSTKPNENKIYASELGRIYVDYWKGFAKNIDWAKLGVDLLSNISNLFLYRSH